MAFQFTSEYAPEVVERVRGFYQTLSEKDQRRSRRGGWVTVAWSMSPGCWGVRGGPSSAA